MPRQAQVASQETSQFRKTSSRKKKETFLQLTWSSRRKHVQSKHHITEQQRLQQVWFIKDAERQAKKHGLTGKEVKDLNAFAKDKIKETTKEHNCDMHAMSNFKTCPSPQAAGSSRVSSAILLLRALMTRAASWPTRNEVMGKNEQGATLRIIRI
eukprot:14857619-Ditylum_brightwellii.AAC.1